MISYSEAVKLLNLNKIGLGSESIALKDSFGRIIAQEVYADRNYPPFNRATMDGVAIRFDDWQSGCRKFKIEGELLAGSTLILDNKIPGIAIKIMTGASVPAVFDVVIKVEECVIEGDYVSFKIENLNRFGNIALEGEDFKKGDLVVSKGTTISVGNISSLASVGASKVELLKVPKIGLITTGDEVIQLEEKPQNNQIRNSNLYTISCILEKFGTRLSQNLHCGDDKFKFKEYFETFWAQCDVLIITGAVSAGVVDFVPSIIRECGIEVIFHKVAIKPGKPILFGRNELKTKVVFALPGNPLSVLTSMKVFVEPFLRTLHGMLYLEPFMSKSQSARLKKNGLDEFLPAVWKIENGESKVEIININGSGDVSATVKANAIVQHKVDYGDLNVGDLVPVVLL